MKLDAVAQNDYKLSHELASKAVGHDNDHMMVNKWKADFDSVGEHNTVNKWKADFDSVGEHNIASHIESKSREEVFLYDNIYSPGPLWYAHNEASTMGDRSEFKHLEASYSPPSGKLGWTSKENDINDETVVTEIELPETLACFTSKDDACHIVKDICIDDGGHSLEKVLVDCNENESLFDHSVSNEIFGPAKRMTINTVDITGYHEPIAHGLESSSVSEEHIFVTDGGAVQCFSGSTLKGGDELTAVSPSEPNIEQLRPLQDFDTDPWKVDSSSLNGQKLSVQETDQGTLEDGSSTTKDVLCTAEEVIKGNESKGRPANSEVEVVTLHCDSGVAGQSSSEESKGNKDHQVAQGQYISKHEEATLDSTTVSARRPFVHLGSGDLNFQGPASLSGPTASLGHIPYSGSISHRSDSSTASARSFAFPILPSEWNSSPVKMAKADRRNFRKHRGWRMGLLCCRF